MTTETSFETPRTPETEAERLGIRIVICDGEGRPRLTRLVRLATYLRGMPLPCGRAA